MSQINFWIFLYIIIFVIQGMDNNLQSMSNRIDQYVLECYKTKVPLLPMTIKTLIEIIRKVESNPYFAMDMRMLSNSILHRFWRDGIEREPLADNIPGIIPFRPSGFQSYKYRILIEKLIPDSQNFFPNETLNINEQCTLHFMLSSSVDEWERGDESDVCAEAKTEQKQNDYTNPNGYKRSSCPIEKGVISAGFHSTISPSHVIGAVATTLAPMQVKQAYLFKERPKKLEKYENKYVDNKWAATLAGDLAEVIVIQAPLTKNIYLGPGGKWNDSIIPELYYMMAESDIIKKGFWQCTDAELLGSLDGLIMAQEAKKWIGIQQTLRLSQLLEMYYLSKGGDFPSQNRICNRRRFFLDHLINQEKVIQLQTQYFAEVLALDTPHYFIDNEYIVQQSQQVFVEFKRHMLTLLGKLGQCPEQVFINPRIELNLIFDSTWTTFEKKQMMMQVCNIIDVSIYGSRITIISGKGGELITYRANSSIDVYMQWENAKDEIKDPVNLELSQALIQIREMIHSNESSFQFKHSSAYLTIVIGMSSSLNDKELSNSLSVLPSIKLKYPDMQFLYITTTSHSRSYEDLLSMPGAQSDRIQTVEVTNLKQLKMKLKELITGVPRSLRPAHCLGPERVITNVTYEEYISPEIVYYFKIHPNYLCGSAKNLRIKFQNSDYGYLDICLSREEGDIKPKCQQASLLQDLEFNVTKPCHDVQKNKFDDPLCRPIYITVVGHRSLRKCTEKDCQLPDQLRFYIVIQGLKCIKDYVTCTGSIARIPIVLHSVIIFLYFLIS